MTLLWEGFQKGYGYARAEPGNGEERGIYVYIRMSRTMEKEESQNGK